LEVERSLHRVSSSWPEERAVLKRRINGRPSGIVERRVGQFRPRGEGRCKCPESELSSVDGSYWFSVPPQRCTRRAERVTRTPPSAVPILYRPPAPTVQARMLETKVAAAAAQERAEAAAAVDPSAMQPAAGVGASAAVPAVAVVQASAGMTVAAAAGAVAGAQAAVAAAGAPAEAAVAAAGALAEAAAEVPTPGPALVTRTAFSH
jgi:hypothetical protein